jgi:hypothetical protein
LCWFESQMPLQQSLLEAVLSAAQNRPGAVLLELQRQQEQRQQQHGQGHRAKNGDEAVEACETRADERSETTSRLQHLLSPPRPAPPAPTPVRSAQVWRPTPWPVQQPPPGPGPGTSTGTASHARMPDVKQASRYLLPRHLPPDSLLARRQLAEDRKRGRLAALSSPPSMPRPRSAPRLVQVAERAAAAHQSFYWPTHLSGAEAEGAGRGASHMRPQSAPMGRGKRTGGAASPASPMQNLRPPIRSPTPPPSHMVLRAELEAAYEHPERLMETPKDPWVRQSITSEFDVLTAAFGAGGGADLRGGMNVASASRGQRGAAASRSSPAARLAGMRGLMNE